MQEAKKRPDVLRLMTYPGVGPLTALAFVLIIGTWERFPRGKQIGNYVGMIPSEGSSGGKQRLGHISRLEKSLHLCLAGLRIRRFDPIAEAPELPDHSRGALLLAR